MGGVAALNINDRFVNHQLHIMEGRVKNAAVEYMRSCEHNRQLRMSIDEQRRHRIIQLGKSSVSAVTPQHSSAVH